MRWPRHGTSVILVLLATVATVYAVVDARHPSTEAKVARAGKVLGVFDPLQVEELTLARRGERTPAVVRRGDGGPRFLYEDDQAGREPADEAAVDGFLRLLEGAAFLRAVAPEDGRGLETPEVVLTLRMGQGPSPVVLRLGAESKAPVGAAYLSVDEGGQRRTLVVGPVLAQALRAGGDGLRERALVAWGPDQITGITLAEGVDTLRLRRIDAFSFLDEGTAERAPRALTDRLLTGVTSLRAQRFPKAGESLGDLGRAITLELSGAPGTIQVRLTPSDGAAGGVLAHVSSPLRRAWLAAEALLPFRVAPEGRQDDGLFAARADEVAEVRMETLPSGTVVDLARKGASFHLREPRDADLTTEEAAVASASLEALLAARGRGPAAGQGPGTLRARIRITRGQEGGDEVVELFQGHTGWRARRAVDGVTKEIDPTTASLLLPSEVLFRSPRVFPTSVDGASFRTLRLLCGGVEQEAEATAEGFRLRLPAGYPADNGALLGVADAVLRLRVVRWLGASAEEQLPIARDTCRAEVTVTTDDGGTRLLAVTLGEGNVARAEGEPTAFEVPADFRRTLGTLLVDRYALAVPRTRVGRITLRRGARTLVVVPGAPAFDPLVGALDALKADRVIHLGPSRAAEGTKPPALEVIVDPSADGGSSHVLSIGGQRGEDGGPSQRFVRVSGIEATYAVDEARLQPFFDGVP